MEEEIREGKGEELEAQDQDGKAGGGVKKVRICLSYIMETFVCLKLLNLNF